ncbi:MAG: thioesterase family protein [Planctomycetota bacterium]
MRAEFTMRRRVQFAETDMAGVLHFSNYFRYMEEIEHAFWRSLQLTVFLRDADPRLSWPRVAVSCEYFVPLRFEDELEMALRLTKVGDKSLNYEVEFRRDGERCAVGRFTAVCCVTRPGSFSPTAIPPAIRAKLEGDGGD